MNYNFISQLLDNGLSEEELIASLSKSVPKLAKKARQMFFGGWSPKEILNVFSQDKDVQKTARKGLKPVTPAEMASMHLKNSYNNIPQSVGEESKEKLTEFTKKAAPYALGAIASPVAGSVINSALQRALPQTDRLTAQLSNQTQNQPQTPELTTNKNQTVNSNLSSQPPLNSELGNISQQKEITQPEIISNPKEYLEKKGVLQTVNESLKRGNNPEQVAAELGIKRTGKASIDPELLQNIEKYAQEAIRDEAMQPEGSFPTQPTNLQPKSNELVKDEFIESEDKKAFAGEKLIDIQKRLKIGLPQAERLIEERDKLIKSPKIEKNSLVSSPNGIGEVKEIRNGQALVEIDGKKHKVAVDELEQSPLPEKELSALFDDLVSGIEKETGEDFSRMVQWAGYNPETNTLQFLPHTGKLYKYGNISPEDAALLTDILSTRKTSGSNFIGAWKAGSKSPIGAALSKLIKKLQSERGGKGKEYEETHESIYSAYEPAIEAKKKKKK